MNGLAVLHWPPDLSNMPPAVVLWPVLFGLGAYLLMTAQPLGRPKPNVLERLRRLDVDERMRMRLVQANDHPLFRSPLLERMLRPAVEDVGRWLRNGLQRFGLGRGVNLTRKLELARANVTPVQYFGEKALVGLMGALLPPGMNAMGIHPFGAWPLWLSIAGFAVGFVAPDWELERRLAARRTACLMELPSVLDMICLAASAGMALEPAVAAVALRSRGVVGQELQHAIRQAALGQSSLMAALGEMAERNGIPELTSFVGQLRAANDQGLPLVETLSTQADALREQKRIRIVEEGGKASVRMIIPVALFVFPTLFVVLLVPAGVQLLHLSG